MTALRTHHSKLIQAAWWALKVFLIQWKDAENRVDLWEDKREESVLELLDINFQV